MNYNPTDTPYHDSRGISVGAAIPWSGDSTGDERRINDEILFIFISVPRNLETQIT